MWYKPSGVKVTTLDEKTTHNEDGSTFLSEINMTTTTREDYGKYKCVVANLVGSDEHFVVVKQLCK